MGTFNDTNSIKSSGDYLVVNHCIEIASCYSSVKTSIDQEGDNISVIFGIIGIGEQEMCAAVVSYEGRQVKYGPLEAGKYNVFVNKGSSGSWNLGTITIGEGDGEAEYCKLDSDCIPLCSVARSRYFDAVEGRGYCVAKELVITDFRVDSCHYPNPQPCNECECINGKCVTNETGVVEC